MVNSCSFDIKVVSNNACKFLFRINTCMYVLVCFILTIVDAQCVVDIYLNYDCDLSLSNIFKRLVNDLSRIAQGRHALEVGITAQQEKAMRVKGLECLVSILKCLVEWCQDLYINPSTTGLNAVTNIGQLARGPVDTDQEETDDQDDTSADQSVALKEDTPTNRRKQNHLRGASIAVSHPATYHDHGLPLIPAVTSAIDKLSASQTSLNSATDDPEQFESQRQRKEIMEHGMTL